MFDETLVMLIGISSIMILFILFCYNETSNETIVTLGSLLTSSIWICHFLVNGIKGRMIEFLAILTWFLFSFLILISILNRKYIS